MAKIMFEKEVCEYLNIPNIPKKEFDGKTSFKDGVAVIKLPLNSFAYAVCSFDTNKDKEPRVKKVFSQEPFKGIEKIFVVPTYMDTNVEKADLDEQSKQAAARLAQEAQELTAKNNDDDEIKEMEKLPEWIFPEITNKEEAEAWLSAYNSRNKIRGKIPTNPETIKMRLLNIYSQTNKRKKK